jgi:hypothetical protein
MKYLIILIFLIIPMHFVFSSIDQKDKVLYRCVGVISIKSSENKYQDIVEYLESAGVELIKREKDKHSFEAIENDLETARGMVTNWARRKFGWKFQGHIDHCELNIHK